MAKQQGQKFQCNECAAVSNSWSGKCFDCGNWDTLVAIGSPSKTSGGSSGALAIVAISDQLADDKSQSRTMSGLAYFDQVLGGGIVTGSVTLLAGQPGIGKSTMLLQATASASKSMTVLYISGEESLGQVSARAQRLGLQDAEFDMASSNSTDEIADIIHSKKYDLVVVDSIQTIASENLTGSQGGVSQVVGSARVLIQAAKNSDTALLVVGHVTKEGNVAGPKVLEHLVDVVMQLEGDKFAGFKILRALKNRYGSIDETAVLQMDSLGMHEVLNPSAALLEERSYQDGSVIFAAVEGNKPMLVEIQVLTNKSAYGFPKRTAVGFNQNRLNLLLAVLDKRTKLRLDETDVYLAVSGGLTINEPAADLAVCMAVASSVSGMALGKTTVVFGEVGLGGEVRRVTQDELRVKEAKKLGYNSIIKPQIGKPTYLKDLLNKHLKPKG